MGLIGSVKSSLLTLQKLIDYDFDIVGVWGFETDDVKNVSGYCKLYDCANLHGVKYYSFNRINRAETKQEIVNACPDILFIVGLSQLVDDEIIKFPRYGCVGFHPTKLPRGRGRAPIAWLVMNEQEGAATFFKIEHGVDSGAIYIQKPFVIDDSDDAAEVERKLYIAMELALDSWLPKLKKGHIELTAQNENEATYYAKRAPFDGVIDWYRASMEVDCLVRATSKPHPGAFSFFGDYKIIIWKSSFTDIGFPLGVVGRVVALTSDGFPVVQCGSGYLIVESYDCCDNNSELVHKKLFVGARLGYYEQVEIYKMRNELSRLKEIVEKLVDER